MFKKFMLMFVIVLSIVLTVNAKEVTDNLEEALNDPQVITEAEQKAEIAEIDAVEKAKEKQANVCIIERIAG